MTITPYVNLQPSKRNACEVGNANLGPKKVCILFSHFHPHQFRTPGLKNPATPFRKTPKNVPVTCVMSSSSTKGGCEGCAANPRALASAKGLMMTHARHLFWSLSVSWSRKNHSKNHPKLNSFLEKIRSGSRFQGLRFRCFWRITWGAPFRPLDFLIPPIPSHMWQMPPSCSSKPTTSTESNCILVKTVYTSCKYTIKSAEAKTKYQGCKPGIGPF